jgi:hypothetical protein
MLDPREIPETYEKERATAVKILLNWAEQMIELEEQRREDMRLMEETIEVQKLAELTIEKYKSENAKLRAVAEIAHNACEELEGHGLYAINKLHQTLIAAGYGGEE